MNYWAVGASFGRTEDMSEEFLEEGKWYDGWADNDDERDDEYLNEVNIGDILVMKSSSTRGPGRKISCTRVKGIGRVVSKDSYYEFKVQWYEIDRLPITFDHIWYAKTVEYMRNDEILDAVKQILINNNISNEGIELPSMPKPPKLKNKLEWRPKPKEGYEGIPETISKFKGVDIDYQKRSKEQKNLGDKGEELVKQREIEFLKMSGLYDKAAKVKIVKDGKGYDILSFDKYGNKKFIEVKTTTANEYYPFNLSKNEIRFMRKYPNQYCIYRIYNYNEASNSGEYYEITGDIEAQLFLEPVNFKVFIKKVG